MSAVQAYACTSNSQARFFHDMHAGCTCDHRAASDCLIMKAFSSPDARGAG